MLEVKQTAKFKRDLKVCVKRHYNLDLITAAIDLLRVPTDLPEKNHVHNLSGNWAGHQECHLSADWLLIYRVEGDVLMLYRTGTHSDLFGK